MRALILLAALFARAGAAQQPVATASLQGIVVNRGSNDAISGVEVELTRLQGTDKAPLSPGAAETYAWVASGGTFAATPPSEIAPEVRYAITGDDGRFVFQNLKEGTYRVVSARVV